MKLLENNLNGYLERDWFRIPEREHVRTPIPDALKQVPPGSWLRVKNIIVRAGYWLQPNDAPAEWLREQAVQGLCNFLNLRFSKTDDFKDVEVMLWKSGNVPHFNSIVNYINRDVEGPFTIDDIEKLMDVVGLYENKFLRRIYWVLRKYWFNQQKREYTGEQPVDLRTFWYVDNDNLPIQGGWKDIRVKHVGKYRPAYGTGGYNYDYIQACLKTTVQQPLIAEQNSVGEMCFIHPLDIDLSRYEK